MELTRKKKNDQHVENRAKGDWNGRLEEVQGKVGECKQSAVVTIV